MPKKNKNADLQKKYCLKNKSLKSLYKNILKKTLIELEEKKTSSLVNAIKIITRVSNKNIIHKKKASKLVSKLTRSANNIIASNINRV
jgi:ribosomal protein S20